MLLPLQQMKLARGAKDREHAMSQKLDTAIISSAMIAAIGNGAVFSKGRDFGAWLGLVPRQMSTGDRTILGKISKQGNRYLRVLFVQAAWVVLLRLKSWDRYGLNGSKPPRSGCITTCWRSHWPTSWPAYPGRFSTRSETSRSQGRQCPHPSLRERGKETAIRHEQRSWRSAMT